MPDSYARAWALGHVCVCRAVLLPRRSVRPLDAISPCSLGDYLVDERLRIWIQVVIKMEIDEVKAVRIRQVENEADVFLSQLDGGLNIRRRSNDAQAVERRGSL